MAKKISKIDKFHIGFGIFNLLGVIIAIIISIWGIRKSEDIARKSGAFDKGSLRFSLGGYFVNPNQELDIYFGLNFSDTSLHLLELPISINNNGNKTVDDVKLIFKYLNFFNIALNDSTIQYESSDASQIERHMITNLPYDQVSFVLNSLNPNLTIYPSELIFAPKEETKGEVNVSAYTKDSVLLNVSTKYTYKFPVIVNLTGKDIVSMVYQININFRKESKLETLIKRVLNEKKFLKQKNNPAWKNSFFVIIPKTKEVIGDDTNKITIMDTNEDSILFCQFDLEKEIAFVFTKEGEVKQLINFF